MCPMLDTCIHMSAVFRVLVSCDLVSQVNDAENSDPVTELMTIL